MKDFTRKYMRAKFIYENLNEKFTDESDPIKDLNIGYGKKPNLKSFKILLFIASKGTEGASLTEIQHYIWVELNKDSEESFWEKGTYNTYAGGYSKMRLSRGYWTDGLYGSGGSYLGRHSATGLLPKYCKKNSQNHKWVLTRMPNPGENIFS
jgi:hypothetical protein